MQIYRDLISAHPGCPRPIMLALHWGTFRLTDEPKDEPPRRAVAAWRGTGLADDRPWIARFGETRRLWRGIPGGRALDSGPRARGRLPHRWRQCRSRRRAAVVADRALDHGQVLPGGDPPDQRFRGLPENILLVHPGAGRPSAFLSVPECGEMVAAVADSGRSLRDGSHLRAPRRRDERMGMAAPVYYTVEMVRALPDDGHRHELVYGELLLTPAPRPWHEIVVARLTFALTDYTRRYPVGFVFGVAADITWGRADVLVQPDVFVAPLDEVRTLDWDRIRGLLLVAEVLSPASLKADRFTKRRRYQEAGVPRYWVVDADERRVEVWTPEDDFPMLERERLAWHPTGAETAFALELSELFRAV